MKKKIVFILWILVMIIGLILQAVKNVSAKTVPVINSQCAVLMERHSGRVLYEKNAHTQRPVASISKIMTAIIAIEEGYLDEYIEISEAATRQVGSSLYLKKGDKVKLIDLIYGLLLRSGNDAAYAISEGVAGSVSNFVYLMNEKAKALGLKNTVFENPSGLDEDSKNLSTAYDFALITRYAMDNPIYRKINNTSVHQAESLNGERYTWYNKHRLINNHDYVVGGKTGYTRLAKRTLVSVGKKDDLELIVVTLNGVNDWQEHLDLLQYGFEEYKLVTLLRKGLFEVKELNQIFYLDDKIVYPIREDELNQFRFFIDVNDYQRYYLHLVKDGEILLTKEIYLYDKSYSVLDNSFTIRDLGEELMRTFRDVFW